MRFTLVPVLLFVATASHAADDAIKASGTLDGKKVQFPAKGVAEGVAETVAGPSSAPKPDLDEARRRREQRRRQRRRSLEQAGSS